MFDYSDYMAPMVMEPRYFITKIDDTETEEQIILRALRNSTSVRLGLLNLTLLERTAHDKFYLKFTENL